MSVVKDRLQLLECGSVIIIVSRCRKAKKRKMLKNAERFTLKPIQHAEIRSLCYGKEIKATNAIKYRTFRPQTRATCCIPAPLPMPPQALARPHPTAA